MDVAKAFTYVTEDEGWLRKLGIGALVSLLGFLVVPLLLLPGYLVGITRNVMNGEERPLPEWDDLGTLFKDGLAIVAAQLVYTLPFWLLTCVAFFVSIGFGGMAEANQDLAAAGLSGSILLIFCLGFLFAIALFFLSPAIVIQYARTNDMGACFRFGEVLGLARDNISDILIAALATFAASFVISLIVGGINIIPCLGQIISVILGIASGPYLMAISGHLYGQIAAKENKMDGFVG